MRLAFLLLLCAVAIAQPPPDIFGWLDSPLARDLSLTEDQRTQIRAVVREFRFRLIDQRAAESKADGELRDLLNDDPVDARKVNEAIERLVAARAEMTRTYSQMSLRVRQALTGQQWAELQRRVPPATVPHVTRRPAPARAQPAR